MLRFALPLMLGNLLQQCYNIADTLIVGQVLGAEALAAVGSSYALIVFITSIFIGLCMGCSAVLSIQYGAKDIRQMKQSIFSSLLIVGGTTLLLNILSLTFLSPIIKILQTPPELEAMTYRYLFLIFLGMIPMAVYNFYAFLLRSVGNSSSPLYFLLISVALNIVLDVLFMVGLKMGVEGAAMATVISQIVSAAGIYLYTWKQFPELRLSRDDRQIDFSSIRKIASFSYLTCMQQSVMNLGILMVQGLVNSFGTTVMAAFAAAVKIDSFAYMPVQDFGNAFSTFIAQNFGARRQDRIRQGIRCAWLTTTLFAGIVSILVFFFATELMRIFIPASEQEIISIGVAYLQIEGIFYIGIGYLFLFYGYFRAISRPSVSLILTIISLGTRVILAYSLAAIPSLSYNGIWWSVPIGWILADIAGVLFYRRQAILVDRSVPNYIQL
ncbi:MAG: MATE family efflux transporter [Parabacteroides sp.]|nr:MATE family efflux transporter [Parabacteroides sp.]